MFCQDEKPPQSSFKEVIPNIALSSFKTRSNFTLVVPTITLHS